MNEYNKITFGLELLIDSAKKEKKAYMDDYIQNVNNSSLRKSENWTKIINSIENCLNKVKELENESH